MPRQFVCKKCGVILEVGEVCECKPFGCWKEIEPEADDGIIIDLGADIHPTELQTKLSFT